MQVIPLHTIGDPLTQEKQLKKIATGDLVLVDVRGENPLIEQILKASRQGKATVAALIGGSFKLMSLTRMGIFDADKFFNGPRAKSMTSDFANVSGATNFDDIDEMLKKKLPGFIYKDIGAWFEVTRYWKINGTENIRRMIAMLAKRYCKIRSLPKPLPPLREPSPAIRHPSMEQVYDSLIAYCKDYRFDHSKQTVIIIYYDGMHYENCVVPVSAIISQLEPVVNVVPISCDGIKNLQAIEKLAFLDGQFIGSLIVHMTWFRLNGGPLGGKEEKTKVLLKQLNVPVFHPVTVYTASVESREKSHNGVSPVDYLANIVLPEIDVELSIIVQSKRARNFPSPYRIASHHRR